MDKLINYIILAILIGLGVLLYMKRDMIMNYFQGGSAPMEQPMEQMMPATEEVEAEEVEVQG